MLTEKEKEWLERRKNICNRCVKSPWCRVGERHEYNIENCRFWEIKVPNKNILLGSLEEDFRDAAEFEARVAEKLAERAFRLCDEMDVTEAVVTDERERSIGWHVLKKVRLAVEDEMDRKS